MLQRLVLLQDHQDGEREYPLNIFSVPYPISFYSFPMIQISISAYFVQTKFQLQSEK
jgi:hypothetical protein